jgi:class 3 adenylate cyclase
MRDSGTRYARRGDASLAYRMLGEGSVDLVYLTGIVSHVEAVTEEPGVRRQVERYTRWARLTFVDLRGTGLSDPADGRPDPDEDVADLVAVLDDAGIERAVVMGYAAGGATAIRLAAAHPERVRALVLYAAMIRALAAPDMEWADDAAAREARLAQLLERWGTGDNLERIAPSLAADPVARAWFGRLERLSASPGAMRTISRAFSETDVRPLLDRIRVPTLVLHRSGDRFIDPRHSRYAAARIPGARYVELPGEDSMPSAGDGARLVAEIEAFVTEGRGRGTVERQLLTVAFTDIVDATGHAARLGDAAWRDRLARHETLVRAEIARFGGREVKTIGDAFLVTFAGAPSDAVRFAAAAVVAVRPLGLELRVGLHTGECELMGEDVGGMAVHIASRVIALAAPGQVLASGTTYGTVVGSGLRWESMGERELRGVPHPWPLFALCAPPGP